MATLALDEAGVPGTFGLTLNQRLGLFGKDGRELPIAAGQAFEMRVGGE